ncbi:uncharacterized protein LOC125279811 [Megalobrama amblycephala]|uniref:uncharacterized protein LOC125279811 n=1 Tax=Megalobrama amblycephala TaxID=75352 RepID=UPI002013EB50|nr:uncharacterized protein LOC125279811 [Megalobrama amblycephala]
MSELFQAGLFSGTVEEFAQHFPAAQKQTEAIKRILHHQGLLLLLPIAKGFLLQRLHHHRKTITLCLLGWALAFHLTAPPHEVGNLQPVISGVDETHVFNSSGENVRVCPVIMLFPDCKSTTWTYSNRSTHSTVELINGGIKKKDTERHERLSLGSDCSLNINKVKKKKDYGFYSCQQFVNGQKQGTDAYVYLHVLHVSVSPSSSSFIFIISQTEISPGLHLLWVNQAGVDLKTDSRYQILFSSGHCIITLTTTLLNEDDNREWRCQLTLRNQLQTSVRYTVKYSVSSSNSEKKSSQTTAAAPTQVVPSTTASTLTPTSLVIVIVVASFAVLLPALILWMIRRKRDDNRRGTDDSEDHQTRPVYPTGQNTLPQQEQTDDHVTYSEVTAYSKNQEQKEKVRCDDKVTYASIRGAKAGSQENCSELYASVNKNHHKSVK